MAGGRRVSAGGWRLCDCRVGSGRAGPGQASLGHGSCGHCFTPHCAAGLSLEPEPFSRLPWGNVMFTAIPIHTQHNEQCSAPPSSVRFSPKSLLSSSRIHPPPSLYLDPSLHHFILLILCGFHIHLSILPCPPPPAASLLFLPSTCFSGPVCLPIHRAFEGGPSKETPMLGLLLHMQRLIPLMTGPLTG